MREVHIKDWGWDDRFVAAAIDRLEDNCAARAPNAHLDAQNVRRLFHWLRKNCVRYSLRYEGVVRVEIVDLTIVGYSLACTLLVTAAYIRTGQELHSYDGVLEALHALTQ